MSLYGHRSLETATKDAHAIYQLAGKETVSILSYNVMRQMHATPKYKPYCHEYVLSAARRKELLLEEILSYDADIVCLQEVDDYELYWVTRLNAAGYDSVYHQRTGNYDDGLVIAFRRILFQIFRTQRVNLNDLCNVANKNLAAKLEQDNIALFVALQPWEDCRFPSPLCVGNTLTIALVINLLVNVQLASNQDHEVVREMQLRYLIPMVEVFNADFQMPLIVAGSFNATPDSNIYHTMRSGRARPRPQPPTRMAQPTIGEVSSSTITILWETPISIDGPVLAFRVDQRVNGSTTIGFTHEVLLKDSSLQSYKATMLSAGNVYEFRVSAKNSFGWSDYSLPSKPTETQKVFISLNAQSFTKSSSKLLKTSYGSGKTPRFLNGAVHEQQCPRPSRIEPSEALYDALAFRGDREEHLEHFEVFESAYCRYNAGGEPVYTFASDVFTGTIDYIFFTKKELAAFQLLTIPTLSSLKGQDAREPSLITDHDYLTWKPEGWDTKPKNGLVGNPKYSGEWPPDAFRVQNPKCEHHWLPNDLFASDHIALMVVLAFREEELPTSWN
ncbi:hypothetical protein THRCLA_01225 [Thraustotheca clavata]|uniref:Fibronectin type-III domain-containing protein n=1 Tax=Thraustotheca clavata TaxID=74557 RepID=A0A1W0A8X2_9STRA|nr:hypothetical protein THRCLA_01225 [Thraustotheca clavata]